MPMVNYARRIPVQTINADINSFRNLSTVGNYIPARSEATPEDIKHAYEEMVSKQEKETELMTLAKLAVDEARQAEVDFHEAVMAMKESIRGQFGPNSNEAQAIGYKRKSEYKRPRRNPKTVNSVGTAMI